MRVFRSRGSISDASIRCRRSSAPPPEEGGFRSIEESNPKRGEHAGAPVVGGRPPEPDQHLRRALIQRRGDELTDTKGAGSERISLIGCNEFDSGGCGDFDHGQPPLWNVAKRCRNGTAQCIRNIDHDTLTVEGVDHGVDGSFTAVCHGHSHAFGPWDDGHDAKTHRVHSLHRAHRLLERIRRGNELHRTGVSGGSPASTAAALSTARMPIVSRVAWPALAVCGVSTSPGASSNAGLTCGSPSYTSKAAPRIWPSCRAAISAASSTTPPRAVLIRYAVGFMAFNAAASIRCLVWAVSGVGTVTTSLSANKVGVSTKVTPSSVLPGVLLREGAMAVMSKACARRATA